MKRLKTSYYRTRGARRLAALGATFAVLAVLFASCAGARRSSAGGEVVGDQCLDRTLGGMAAPPHSFLSAAT